ncbi:MAG: sulfite reductase, beta subunit (hemoprotein) [Firmicutes bacterium]|nr:sulfite reductase, beta subunit (hemoprotein) [Bacillota bacterium]
MNYSEPGFRIPETVKEDTEKYEDLLKDFLAGRIDPVRFKGYRVPMGIYGQRGEAGQDLYMVRVRVPGGVLSKKQLELLNDISSEYGEGFLHFTTRQDIQIHRVRIEDTPEILYKLLEGGHSPRGGGGNTVRNILNSPRAGVNPEEVFDTTPHMLALSEYLLKYRSSFNLPRKYKIAFSSTAEDDALATVNDLGFIASYKEGKKGFKVYGAGGMGNNPKTAVVIDEFIEEDKIFQVAEAIKRLFDDYGDRSNKHKARLRFVRERLGDKGFIEKYKEYLAAVNQEELDIEEIRFYQEEYQDLSVDDKEAGTVAKIASTDFLYKEKREGYYSLELRPVNGDMTSSEINGLLELIKDKDISLRTTARQGLLLRKVKITELEEIIEGINNINSNLLVPAEGTSPIACKGASTCRLGLCLSPELSREIRKVLLEIEREFSSLLPQIYISGCPNSCGQHLIANIGFEGKASRYNGRLVPHYALLLGGETGKNAGLAVRVIDIPARRIPDFLTTLVKYLATDESYHGKELFNQYLAVGGKDKIKELASQFTEVPTYQENPEIYRDWGQMEDFNLQGRGPGECGTGVMDIIKVDIDSARAKLESDNNDDLYQAVINTARALLVIKGVDSNKDRVIIRKFKDNYLDDRLVDTKYNEILDLALDYRLGDEDDLLKYKDQIIELNKRVIELYNSLNAKLEFELDNDKVQDNTLDRKNRTEDQEENYVAASAEDDTENESEDQKYFKDLRGVKCPMNFVKAKLYIEPLAEDTIVDFYLDDGAPIKNVPRSLASEGHEILSQEQTAEGYYHLQVRKK